MAAEHHQDVLVDKVRQEGERILHFWRNNAIRADEGFHGEITHEGVVQPDANRGVILAARILWTFSNVVSSHFAPTDEHRKIADQSFQFLRKHFWDPVHLGFYWMIDKHHHPVTPRKHIYAQSFAIYALAEYYAASGTQEALVLAQLTYELIEKYAADSQYGGYFESFTRAWERDSDPLSPVNLNAAKSMNTHLHLLEAYTRLYTVWPNQGLRQRIQNLLDVASTHILDDAKEHYQLFFEADWTVKSDVISFGHDIEGSWLMLESAEAIHDSERIDVFKSIAVRMVDATLARGVDTDNGVLNEGRKSDIIDDEKHWWPQAEAVVGCVNAYQITGEERYLDKALAIWEFIERFIRDETHGEWYWKVSREGKPDKKRPIVDPWKCPYHNTRACVEVWRRLSGAEES